MILYTYVATGITQAHHVIFKVSYVVMYLEHLIVGRSVQAAVDVSTPFGPKRVHCPREH